MKIPKLSSISSDLKSLSIEDLYNLAMENLATHNVSYALIYLVIYVHKTGCDLSKEMIMLAKNSSDLFVCVHVAKALEKSFSDRLNDNLDKLLKGDTVSSDSSKDKSKDSWTKTMDLEKKQIIKEIKKRDLLGLDLVLVDKDHTIFRYDLNSTLASADADFGLDLLKQDILRSAERNGHDMTGFSKHDSHSPNNSGNDDWNNLQGGLVYTLLN